ncbi:KAP family P-loop NTPase fold protein [Rubellicoccus peritrichatus]|uniref:P-loop NTPase fold protein n=1 Tax=Rubellicoccus peritrichatus TaxID=3080537 RepID=A0AAQ3L8L9_9BACT|nr:P-loop NTPase fold protein [Puniceicoccus sp. CR14]WOO41345.1 P-loop NTPase fold protein [Puniceicoccus sp. CR14]
MSANETPSDAVESSDIKMPSKEEVASLPREAQSAFAVRCVLRQYSLIGRSKELFELLEDDASLQFSSVLAACLVQVAEVSPDLAKIASQAATRLSDAARVETPSFIASSASLCASGDFVEAFGVSSFIVSYAPERISIRNDFNLLKRGDFPVNNGHVDWSYFQRPLFDGAEIEIDQWVDGKKFEELGAGESLRLWESFFYGKPPSREEIARWLLNWESEYREFQQTTQPRPKSQPIGEMDSNDALGVPDAEQASEDDAAEEAAVTSVPSEEQSAEEATEDEALPEESEEAVDEAPAEEAPPEEVEEQAAELPPINAPGAATCSAEKPALVDSLDRQKLVESLANMLSMEEQGTPLTLGLFGHWGSGKSTIMSLLQKELSSKETRHKYRREHSKNKPGFEFLFSWFNAWEYEHTDNIRAGLAQEVVNGLLSSGEYDETSRTLTGQIDKTHKRTLQWRHLRQEHKDEFQLWLYKAVGALVVILSGLIGSFFSELLGAGIVGLGAYFLIEFVKQGKQLWDHPLATELATFFKLPSYRKELGQIPVIREQLEGLCNIRLQSDGKPKRLVVFVDDLDRCRVDTIAKAFDAIRLIANINNVIVVVGIDERIAFKAMGQAYKDYADQEKGRSLEDVARDYLGKIIQVPVRLETPSAIGLKSYVEDKLFPKKDRATASRISPDPKPGQDSPESLMSGFTEVNYPQSPVDLEIPFNDDDEKDIVVENDGVLDPTSTGNTTKVEDAQQREEEKQLEEQKTEKELEHMKDTDEEVAAFSKLNALFGFNNPRQLHRLRNTYRLLKSLYPKTRTPGDSDAEALHYPEGEMKLLMMLFWLEFRLERDVDYIRAWKKQLNKPTGSEADSIIGIFHSDFLSQINFRKVLFPFKDVTLQTLEQFTLTCLLPYPAKEVASVKKVHEKGE